MFGIAITSMIKEGILFLHEETTAMVTAITSSTTATVDTIIIIPDWFGNVALWWSEGEISDDEFVNSVQYLLDEKIILLMPDDNDDDYINNDNNDGVGE